MLLLLLLLLTLLGLLLNELVAGVGVAAWAVGVAAVAEAAFTRWMSFSHTV